MPGFRKNFDYNAAMLSQGVDPSMYGGDPQAMMEDMQARMAEDPQGFTRGMLAARSRQQYEQRFGSPSPMGASQNVDQMLARLEQARNGGCP